MNPPVSDRDVIRQTSHRIALQTAAVFAVSIIALVAIAALVVVRTQYNDGQRLLSQAIADSDAVTDPPSGIYIYQVHDGVVRSSAGMPGPLPYDRADIATVEGGGAARSHDVSRDGRDFLVSTGRRDDTVVQAAFDLTGQKMERNRLLRALGVASLLGILISALVGTVISRRAIRPLGAALERQRRFIADASHELRTPLTQVHTRAQLLRRGLARSADHPDLLADAEQLTRSTRLFGEIIDDLLLSAQMRDQPQRLEHVDIAQVAADVIDAETPRASDSHIALSVDADDQPHVVQGSPAGLRRVINSLVDNALGHTPPGGHIVVKITADKPGWIVCAVIDNGVGFDAATGDRMFERFGRGERGTGRRYGLGLALVQEIVDAHGGSVLADSPPGGGAVFTVRLPASDHS